MWIEIFKSGSHTDASGKQDSYGSDTLDRIVETYNQKIGEDPSLSAPVVKGHPATNDPAFGWVERLARRGNKIIANIKDLSGEFIDEIKQGRFKKVSMAIYPSFMLRHVGFLGAATPAVKGLKPIQFAEGEFDEFENPILSIEDNSEKNNVDEKPENNDGSGIDELKNLQKSNEELQKLNEQFVKQYEELMTEHNCLTKQNKEYSERITLIEKESRLKEFREFANNLIEDENGSIITPAQADGLIDIMEMAYQYDLNNADKTFSEGNSNVELVKEFVSALKPVFTTNEFARRNNVLNLTSELDFSNKNVSLERLKVHEKAKNIQLEIPGLSYEEAVCQAQKSDKQNQVKLF
jgi:hypothetical protein